MCGIAGIYNIDLPGTEKRRIISVMTDRMRHRGPDGGQIFSDGIASLGHRRLSIITPDATANQPMRRGPLVIVYNGELYNYKEERLRLQNLGVKFTTQSDTEVLLALYEFEGAGCLNRLNGIFAFAIYNEDSGHLFCARDQFGVKPFIYMRQGKGLVFASELKSLLSSDLTTRTIDLEALSLLLETGSIPQPYTMVENVKTLLPGHFMVCTQDDIRVHQYYKLSPAAVRCNADEEWKDLVHEALRRTVREQLVADVPIGAFLSGGVDSGLIAALMRELSPSVKTYSVGFEGEGGPGHPNETRDAEEVARYLETDHFTYTISDQEASADLTDIVEALDHPSVDGVNSYYVSKISGAHVRAALSGTGADEIFAGYSWFQTMRAYENAPLVQKAKYALHGQVTALDVYKSLHGVYRRRMSKAILGDNFRDVDRPLRRHMARARGTQRTSDLTIHSFLQNQLLPDIDTASMAHALEVRVPYLSVPLVETALALPNHLKLGRRAPNAPIGSYAAEGTKKILVDIAQDYLPKGFDTRPKRGFSLPMSRWLNTIWKEEFIEATSEQTLRQRGLFDAKAVARVKDASSTGLPWTQSWLLLSVELWCRNVLSKKDVSA